MLNEMLMLVRAVGDSPNSTVPDQFAARMLRLVQEAGAPLRLPFAALTTKREEFERARVDQ